ncbi:glycosyltransferase [Lysobacter korlensis]|uniref:Glycosyltransferase n=1 Tax=Lysobacter korlensis TaxID=553636 RepID=A0ABV6RNE1_9GAMM
MSDARLPEGRHFALTWTVPETYGGQTSSMLHRSRAFVQVGGVPVDVLTFDPRADYPAFGQRLRERRELIDGMRLLNVWDWLRDAKVARRPEPLGSPQRVFTPLGADPAYRSERRDGVEVLRTRYAADGKTELQVDHFRTDGSLLLSDRRDGHQEGVVGGRSLVLCDRSGEPIRSWGKSWSLYSWWLDRLTKGADAFLIVDSRPMAEYLRTYRKPGRATVHVVHGSHLLRGRVGPWGRLVPSRAAVFRDLDAFDSVVFLTHRQRRDAELLSGRHRNLAVIPNSRPLPPLEKQRTDRARNAGAMLSALSELKRVDHGIRAVLLARRLTGTDLHLDIYGEGHLRRALQRQIAEAHAEEFIRLHGYQPDARDRLAEVSFLLMTSRTEGFALVLLEAMAAGCIPISYDIRYGPAELIEHGENGFLVSKGGAGALAHAILQLQRMPPEQVDRMRRNARRTAERYTDEAVLPLWTAELTAALARNRASLP